MFNTSKTIGVFFHGLITDNEARRKNQFICLFAARWRLFTNANIVGEDEEKMKIGKKVLEGGSSSQQRLTLAHSMTKNK